MKRGSLVLLLVVASLSALSTGSTAGSTRAATASWQPFDFNGDGYRDLAVGSVGAAKLGKPWVGAVTALFGAQTGLSSIRRQTIHQGLSWVPDTLEANDRFGSAMASGNFDGDAYADLAVGSEREQFPNASSYGSVTLLFGGPAGFAKGVRYVTPPNNLPSCNTFGGIVTSGDFNADGYSDAVAGSNCNQGIWVIPGRPNARAGGAPMQNLETIESVNYSNMALAAGDGNGAGYADLAETDYRDS